MKIVFELSLKRIMKQRLTVVLMFLFPIILILVPQPEGMPTPTIGYGIFGLVILFSAFLLSKQIIEDRQNKTIIRIAASPMTHRNYLIGHLSAYMLVLGLQILFFWLLSILFWTAPIEYYLWGLPMLLSFTVMTICFSLFWHTFFKTYSTSIAVYSIAANLLAVMGGLSFPLEYMPDTLRLTAIVLPTYWYAYGLELITDGNYVYAFLSLLILLAFAIIFLVIGSKRRFE